MPWRRVAIFGVLTSAGMACSPADQPTDAIPAHATPAGSAGAAQAGAAATGGSSAQAGTGSPAAGEPNALGGANGGATAGGASGGANSGTGNAGTSGTSAGGTANGSCPAHAQLCLDFEDGAYPGWNKKESGGTVTVDATRASHGSQALLISVPATKRGAMIENHGAPLFPLPKKQLWGRMMVYFDGVPDGHTDMARAGGTNGALPNYNVGEQHDSVMLNYYAGSSATDCWARPKPEKKIPNNVWMCWEWSFDSGTNHIDFWMDGQLLRSVDGTGDGCLQGNGVWQAPPAFESLSVGEQIAEVSSSTAYRAWIDDVAVSNSARVGCPPPP